MATKKIVALECDLCDSTAEPNPQGKYPNGWVSIEIKGLTFNDRNTYDQVKFEVCPKCLAHITKAINERSQ